MYVDGTALAPRGAARQSHDEQHDAPPVITLRKHALILHPGVVVYSNGNRNRVTGVDELPPWAEVTRARLRYHASASGAKRAVGNSANFTSASFAYTRPRATGRSADAPRASTCLRVDIHDIHPHEANQVLHCAVRRKRLSQPNRCRSRRVFPHLRNARASRRRPVRCARAGVAASPSRIDLE